MWVGDQCHAPATLPLGKTWYPLYRRLGGPQNQSGWVWKILPPPPHWDTIPGSSSYWVTIPTTLFRPTSWYKRFKFHHDINCCNYDSPCAVHKVLLTLQQSVQQCLLFSRACLPHQPSSVPAWSRDNVAMTSHLLDRFYLEEWAESWQTPLSHSQVVSEIQWKFAYFVKSNETFIYLHAVTEGIIQMRVCWLLTLCRFHWYYMLMSLSKPRRPWFDDNISLFLLIKILTFNQYKLQ